MKEAPIEITPDTGVFHGMLEDGTLSIYDIESELVSRVKAAGLKKEDCKSIVRAVEDAYSLGVRRGESSGAEDIQIKLRRLLGVPSKGQLESLEDQCDQIVSRIDSGS